MTQTRPDQMLGAEAFLRSMKTNGIDYLFANPGSDFAPIIETYAAAGRTGDIPQEITAPHENVCVAMAHGYWLATGRMQAAAVHVNVGLANAVMGLLNAHADDVPIFMMSGRNPLTEHDRPGSRQTPIQYGQEMFDQSALVREACKWDYELRYAENAADLVSRACAIARMEPVGSVYTALPREPLCEMTDPPGAPVQVAPSIMHPDPEAIAKAAAALAHAKNPLIICSRGDAAGAVSRELQAIAAENAIPVSEVFVTRSVIPSGHPCNIGGDLTKTMKGADVVLVVDCGVAWIEAKVQPDPDATVIHLGPDPLFTRIPVRSYRTTQAIQTNVAAGVRALRAALPGKADPARMAAITAKNAAFRATIAANAAKGAKGLATKPYVAKCVSDILGEDGVVFSERGGPASWFELKAPNQWFGNTQAGGLGWCLPAAMGHQLADRDHLTICLVGDGSYMFANPIACHQVAAAQDLPLLTIVLNNGGWDAVRLSTLEVYPKGVAAAANQMPMVPFAPVPDYGAIAAAAGCHAETVEAAEDLPAALARALRAIREERRQAVLDVRIGMEGA
jgi:acetolactate synthase-1/2/3 large subunit